MCFDPSAVNKTNTSFETSYYETKDKIVERLLEQKLITTKEAIVLLKEVVIEKQQNQTIPPFDPFWYNPDPFKPLRFTNYFTTTTNNVE